MVRGDGLGLTNIPWTLHLIWKLLQNDPGAVGLFRSNPFPQKPPRYIRAVLYRYSFVRPNSQGLWWKRENLGLWLPPLSADNPDLQQFLRSADWLRDYDLFSRPVSPRLNVGRAEARPSECRLRRQSYLMPRKAHVFMPEKDFVAPVRKYPIMPGFMFALSKAVCDVRRLFRSDHRRHGRVGLADRQGRQSRIPHGR